MRNEYWPFLPGKLTDIIKKDTLEVLLAGIGIKLGAPLALIQVPPHADVNNNQPENLIHPASTTGSEMRYYPEFCKKFCAINAEQCASDSQKRANNVLNCLEKDDDLFEFDITNLHRCHMGLITLPVPVIIFEHCPAILIGGKFILQDDEDRLEQNVRMFFRNSSDPSQMEELIDSILDIRTVSEDELKIFHKNFIKAAETLNDVFRTAMVEKRKGKENKLKREINELLFHVEIDILDNFRKKIANILQQIKDFFSLEFVTLFLSDEVDATVLPVFATAGHSVLPSLHFNWRKADLSVDHTPSQPIFPITNAARSHASNILRGFKGKDAAMFNDNAFILPVPGKLKGLLVGGPFLSPSTSTSRDLLFWNQQEGKALVSEIGTLVVSQVATTYLSRLLEEKANTQTTTLALTAHSIRSAIHSISSGADRVRRKYGQEDPILTSTILGNIVEESFEVKDYINLLMKRPDDRPLLDIEERELEKGPIYLCTLLESCMENLHSARRNKKIIFEVDSSLDDLPEVWGDKRLLKLVFLNILDNAIQYAKPDTKIRIYPKKSFTPSVSIEDYGWCIPANHLEKIFDVGYQVEGIKERYRRGVGLGLAQSKKFIELHKGKITARSRPAHDGADLRSHLVTLTVTLPETSK